MSPLASCTERYLLDGRRANANARAKAVDLMVDTVPMASYLVSDGAVLVHTHIHMVELAHVVAGLIGARDFWIFRPILLHFGRRERRKGVEIYHKTPCIAEYRTFRYDFLLLRPMQERNGNGVKFVTCFLPFPHLIAAGYSHPHNSGLSRVEFGEANNGSPIFKKECTGSFVDKQISNDFIFLHSPKISLFVHREIGKLFTFSSRPQIQEAPAPEFPHTRGIQVHVEITRGGMTS